MLSALKAPLAAQPAPLAPLAAPLARFAGEERGSMTVLSIFWLCILCALGGISLDMAHAYRARTVLQRTADSVALGGLYQRSLASQEEARSKALTLAALNLGATNAGAVTAGDIAFGTWDEESRTFTEDPNARTALRVQAAHLAARNTELPTFLLRIIGQNSWDVAAEAVAETYQPTCLREGFIAEGTLDLQSNNLFTNGFCMHSNTAISINQNNTFESGTIVSMPSTDLLDAPASAFDKNEGLEEALRESFYNIRILDRIEPILTALASADTEVLPDYVTDSAIQTITGKSADTSAFLPGHIYRITCTGGKFTISGGTMSQVAVITSCPVTFGKGVALEDVLFGTTSTDAQSIYAPSGLRLGRADGCAEGGGAQIVTMGGVKVASGLELHGAQILAMGDVNFEANADGIEGASIISAGNIDGTSNATAGYCGSGMEDNFELDYFRLVK